MVWPFKHSFETARGLVPQARDAVPALIKLTKDEHLEPRRAATESLKKIGPKAKEKAGVP